MSEGEESFKNKFEYTVEPASFTEEKYALFKRYQVSFFDPSLFSLSLISSISSLLTR